MCSRYTRTSRLLLLQLQLLFSFVGLYKYKVSRNKTEEFIHAYCTC